METAWTEKTRIRALLVLLLMILAGCGSNDPTPSNELVYGLTLRPSGFDPHIHQSSELGIVFRQVYDTLVYRDPTTREIVPGLAESWEISDDRLSYTFVLRQGVKFHDDTDFNALAVAVNLDRIFDQSDPQTLSQRSQFMLGSFTGYEVLDDYRIRLNLAEPYSPLLDSLAQVYLGMVSPTAAAEYPRDVYQFHQVGTGPYKLVDFIPGDRIILAPNPDYTWGPVFYAPALPQQPERLVFRFFDDPPTRRLALESGEVHVIGELLPTDARTLSTNSRFRLFPTTIPGTPLQFFMNVEVYPTNNTSFRQALIYGTNRSAIVDTVFQGFSPVAWGPISADTLYYNNQLVGLYDYDPARARQILEGIGFEDTDGNGYYDTDDGDLEVVIVHASWSRLPETVQLIQDQWRAIGVKAVVQPVAGFPALIERAREGDYNLISFDTAGYDPAFLNQYYMSTGSSNFSRFSNAELDGLLIQAVQELSPSIRRGLYADIQVAIMNQALVLPIRDRLNLNAASVDIENLVFDAYGWFPILQNVALSGDR